MTSHHFCAPNDFIHDYRLDSTDVTNLGQDFSFRWCPRSLWYSDKEHSRGLPREKPHVNTIIPHYPTWTHHYHQTLNKRRTESQNFNVSGFISQLSLPNPLQPWVKSRMEILSQQRPQPMLQLHLNDQQFYRLLRWTVTLMRYDIMHFGHHHGTHDAKSPDMVTSLAQEITFHHKRESTKAVVQLQAIHPARTNRQC